MDGRLAGGHTRSGKKNLTEVKADYPFTQRLLQGISDFSRLAPLTTLLLTPPNKRGLQVFLQYAFQGQFFDAAMSSLTIQFMAYNADSDRLVDQRVRFTRNSGGCFDITKEARALQVRVVCVCVCECSAFWLVHVLSNETRGFHV